ncbi:Aste57867_945 [Aphanomyces stellatus]|uniref:Aste57867_945 protein n=1 Tax=Aphanomyces stellatus TaxID=120398 RepID=A0A485K972_9STRA|nr:hypothetical protein As57867_000944 [Aphanomyces stellatus]VFT78168.1 Aste57867_945 [Aphanomyces stellatus]
MLRLRMNLQTTKDECDALKRDLQVARTAIGQHVHEFCAAKHVWEATVTAAKQKYDEEVWHLRAEIERLQARNTKLALQKTCVCGAP